ncbi:MAG: hypothetical protein KDC52_17895 [Ignavibacteriae bacterium]|nr:hypothetical protein [Ignavibacteriota bacterium]
MKKIIYILIAISTFAKASNWQMIPEFDSYKLLNVTKNQSDAKIVGTSGLSWADGRQAIIIFISISQNGKTNHYRCNQYFSSDMQQTGEMCYQLTK